MKDLTGNNELAVRCSEWLEAKKQLAKWTQIEKDAKLHILNTLNKHQTQEIICGVYEISMTERKGSEGRKITLEDVGDTIGGRKASQIIKINEIEGRKK